MERETIPFDVLFVGGGPANLAGAIRLMQLARENHLDLEVALIEKGAEIGAHSLSGAILNPRALAELIPDYREKGCPLEKEVTGDAFYFLTEQKAFRVPIVPRYMHNRGFYIVSQSRLTRWLGAIAEEAGVNIFPGFAGKEVLFSDDGSRVTGIRTGDKGIGKDGSPRPNFEPGVDLTAGVTVFGEGARGSLFREVTGKLDIGGRMPQVYETGIKEVIQLPEDHFFCHSSFNDIHFLGYPLGLETPGGGFMYEMSENRISLGYLTALSYTDPFLDPYEMLLRFKRHPFVMRIIEGGKVVEQGARTVSNGGWYTIPCLSIDGAVFVGGSAAIHNVPGLKGIHTAMKSGMLAAEAILHAVMSQDYSRNTLDRYPELFAGSWLRKEIWEGRNFAGALAKKSLVRYLHLGAQYLSEGKGVRDVLPLEEDCKTLAPLSAADTLLEPSAGNAVDGTLLVDKLTGVFLSKTLHREDQPSHILIPDPSVCVGKCHEQFRNPCTRFCPGQVYEFHVDELTSRRELRISPSNCLHCKTCDIKDPFGNIIWTCPEGGDGPGYRQA